MSRFEDGFPVGRPPSETPTGTDHAVPSEPRELDPVAARIPPYITQVLQRLEEVSAQQRQLGATQQQLLKESRMLVRDQRLFRRVTEERLADGENRFAMLEERADGHESQIEELTKRLERVEHVTF